MISKSSVARVAELTAGLKPFWSEANPRRCIQHGDILLLGFGWRYVAHKLYNSPVVEPHDPFEDSQLDHLEAAPRAASMDDLGLYKSLIVRREAYRGFVKTGASQLLSIPVLSVL